MCIPFHSISILCIFHIHMNTTYFRLRQSDTESSEGRNGKLLLLSLLGHGSTHTMEEAYSNFVVSYGMHDVVTDYTLHTSYA